LSFNILLAHQTQNWSSDQ